MTLAKIFVQQQQQPRYLPFVPVKQIQQVGVQINTNAPKPTGNSNVRPS